MERLLSPGEVQPMANNIDLGIPLWYEEPVIKALKDDKHRFVVFLASRRIGKSLIAKGMSVEWASRPGTRIAYICPTSDLCRKFIREIESMLRGSGILSNVNTLDKFVRFINGSQIDFFALEQFSRGAGRYSKMIFDECAFLDSETYHEVFEPMTLEADKIYMCSTPRGTSGIFYESYNRGLSGGGNSDYISFSTTLEESGLYDQKKIDAIKESTTEAIWLQEYCCAFIAGGISAFKDYESRLTKEPAERTKRLFAGIDFSGAKANSEKKDSTVLCIVNERCETVFRKSWPTGDVKTLDEICSLLDLYNVTMAYAEENSMGAVSIQMMQKKFKKITGFTTTLQSKREIVEYSIRNFEQGKGSILDVPSVRRQFGNFVQKRTKTRGLITYENQSVEDHDDEVIGYCLAAWCCHCNTKKGVYHFA